MKTLDARIARVTIVRLVSRVCGCDPHARSARWRSRCKIVDASKDRGIAMIRDVINEFARLGGMTSDWKYVLAMRRVRVPRVG